MAVAVGLELDDPWGPFQPKPFYDSVLEYIPKKYGQPCGEMECAYLYTVALSNSGEAGIPSVGMPKISAPKK